MAGFYGRTGVQLEGGLLDGMPDQTALLRAAEAAVLAGGEIIRARAYELANVSPGIKGNGVNGEHMRDEIKVSLMHARLEGREISARIGINMGIIPYAAHQEFGPRGKPFIRPAIDEMREEVHDTQARIFREHIAVEAKLKTLVRFRRFA